MIQLTPDLRTLEVFKPMYNYPIDFVRIKFTVLMLDSVRCMVFNQEVKFKELQNPWCEPSQRQARCSAELQIQVHGSSVKQT